jgi:hypothetical protein
VSMSRGCVWGQEPGGGGMSATGSLAGVTTLCWRLLIISRGLGGLQAGLLVREFFPG